MTIVHANIQYYPSVYYTKIDKTTLLNVIKKYEPIIKPGGFWYHMLDYNFSDIRKDLCETGFFPYTLPEGSKIVPVNNYIIKPNLSLSFSSIFDTEPNSNEAITNSLIYLENNEPIAIIQFMDKYINIFEI